MSSPDPTREYEDNNGKEPDLDGIITEDELTDMFGEGGKEEIKDYYMPQNGVVEEKQIEDSICKIFDCDQPAQEGWPCCGKLHGYMLANWKIVAHNWETIFCANAAGYINQISIGDIPVEEYQYYANLLKV